MTAPTPGAVLDAESVKLLQRGDLLRALNDEPYAAGGWSAGDTLIVGRVFGQYIVFQGRKGDADYEGRFEFLARPTPEPDAFAEYDACLSAHDDPPAQPEPGAGELEGNHYLTLADLHTIKGWLHGLATAPDLSDVVADGGVSVGDCYQQEAREFAGRLERAITDHTQAQAKIARLEGKVAELRADYDEVKQSLAAEVEDHDLTRKQLADAEADAAKVREAMGIAKEALQRLAVGTERTFNAETAKQMAASTTAIASDAMNRILSLGHQPKALAAQTERRA